MLYSIPSSARTSLRIALLLVIAWSTAGCDDAAIPKKQWENAVQGLYSATLSDNGNYALVGSINHGASLWDMQRGERLFNWNHKRGEYTGITATAISPDNKYAATADRRTIVLWELQSGRSVRFWSAPGDVLSIALTANGDYALLGLTDYTAVIFDVKNGGIKQTFHHRGKVRSVALNRDATLALTGSDDRTAKLWDIRSGKELRAWQHDNQLLTTELSRSGKYAFTAAQADSAMIWDTASGKMVRAMPIKKGPYIAGSSYTAARFSDDGKRLLTGTNSQLVQLWDMSDGRELKRWKVTKKYRWKPASATLLALSFSAKPGLYYALASNGLSFELN